MANAWIRRCIVLGCLIILTHGLLGTFMVKYATLWFGAETNSNFFARKRNILARKSDSCKVISNSLGRS